MNEFMNVATMGTFTGMVTAVTVITQILKHYIKGVDPKWLALIVAVVLIIGVQIIIPGLITYENLFFEMFNVLLVTGSSVGLYEGVTSVLGGGEHGGR